MDYIAPLFILVLVMVLGVQTFPSFFVDSDEDQERMWPPNTKYMPYFDANHWGSVRREIPGMTKQFQKWHSETSIDQRDQFCSPGTQCVALSTCPAAVHAVTSGLPRPPRCDFRGFVEFVCCDENPETDPEDGEGESYSPSHTKQSFTEVASEPAAKQQEILPPSQKACLEYRTDVDNFSNSLELKITLGEIANEGEFPYMVAIGYASNRSPDLSWNCGGTLISDRYVLTAGHCITDTKARNLRPVVLRVGVLRLTEGARRPDDYAVGDVEVHPNYRPPQKYYDLALVRTDRSVIFSGTARPACLAQPAPTVPPSQETRLSNREGAAMGTRLLVAGWGATDPAGLDMSPDLKKAELREVGRDECAKLTGTQKSELPRGIDGSMMCARGVMKGQDTCFGDSGGPLVRRGSVDELLGVTSFGGNPCGGRQPGVYARVAPEIPWIESIVWPRATLQPNH